MDIQTIRGLLDTRPVMSIEPKTTLLEACDFMAHHGLSAVVVLEDGQLRGIVSEKDIIRHVSQFGGFAATPVKAVMTRNVKSVETRSSIVEAIDVLQSGGVRQVPVLDMGNVVIGVLSVQDIPQEYRDLYVQYVKPWHAGVAA